MKQGKLYVIGTGPGASDLLTIRGSRVLARVGHVFAAASAKNDFSVSCGIAREWIPPQTPVEQLKFPMTRDEGMLEQAWEAAAARVLQILTQGIEAAFLTLGDPLIYSTFGYLRRALLLKEPDLDLEIIPGITSFQAAAAKNAITLCEADQSLLIMSGLLPEERLRELLAEPQSTAVILKIARNFESIRSVLTQLDRSCKIISQVEREGCREPLEEEKTVPYLSLLISPPI